VNFDALKEKLRDQFLELWGRIEETSLYMNLREKYEALNPRTQSLIITSAIIGAILFLLSFPYGYFSTSSESLATFDQNRDLIRELLKASKTLKEPSPLPPEMGPDELSGTVSRSLEEFHLVPEQVTPPAPITDKATNMVPDQVKQVGVMLTLKKLNLKQIVEISHKLGTLTPGIKVVGMDIRENATSHYFDVGYRVASFSIPTAPRPMPDAGGKGKRPSGKASKEDDE
jgi:hypothetical protein